MTNLTVYEVGETYYTDQGTGQIIAIEALEPGSFKLLVWIPSSDNMFDSKALIKEFHVHGKKC